MSTGTLGRALVMCLLVACAKRTPPATPAPASPLAAAPAPVEEVKGPILDPVNFEPGSAAIAPAELAAIDRAAEVLKTSDWTVLVVGLADATGDPAANKAISEQRAEAVAAELRTRSGVSESRIVVHGVGERLATGEAEAERKVEFVFYHDEGLPLREVVIRSRVMAEDFRAKRESR